MTGTLRKCRICGFTGPQVTPGIWKSSRGTYHMVNRCTDKLACESRKPARGVVTP